MALNKTQLAHLKKLAHSLKPVVMVGQHGLSENVLNEFDVALTAHELVKAKLNAGDRQERQQMLEQICEQTGAEVVQRIGHVAVFFRRNTKKPKIALPKG